jgi:ABC-type dipeptide/oligopeptide/nickel transport system ATPase component
MLIADEPTTALDVTIQAQVLKLMLELKAKTGAAIVLITHDLGVVAETCQRVVVMYAGRKVEEAPVAELFARPAHPYTRGLLASIARGKAGAAPDASKRFRAWCHRCASRSQGVPLRRAAPSRSRPAGRSSRGWRRSPAPGASAACLRVAEVLAS